MSLGFTHGVSEPQAQAPGKQEEKERLAADRTCPSPPPAPAPSGLPHGLLVGQHLPRAFPPEPETQTGELDSRLPGAHRGLCLREVTAPLGLSPPMQVRMLICNLCKNEVRLNTHTQGPWVSCGWLSIRRWRRGGVAMSCWGLGHSVEKGEQFVGHNKH
ncbi:hypothetical protein D623_10014607 [Myotis brandtii]|uniref:Uncharacterized protein n=1 Tax=Myotis brandtii TaxID=109478 RepID=S7MJD1_MYOBR|nr:hypothetical protein D623_10014607 [Myotis brandtii]